MGSVLKAEEMERRLGLVFDIEARKFHQDMRFLDRPDLLDLAPFVRNIPLWEPKAWKASTRRSPRYNCTNFAFNSKRVGRLQPGRISGSQRPDWADAKVTLEKVASDGPRPIERFIDCEEGEFPVALFHSRLSHPDVKGEYHYFALRRKEPGKLGWLWGATDNCYIWADKNGDAAAKAVPKNDIFAKMVNGQGWQFLGYFAVPVDSNKLFKRYALPTAALDPDPKPAPTS